MDIQSQLNHKAFTLIEVIFAILILSGSLVVLLGIQSASVTKALRDRNQQQAMLIARMIMSGVEASQNLENERFDGQANEVLRKFNMYIPKDEELQKLYETMQVKLDVQEIKIPVPSQIPIDPLKLLRVDLNLSWGAAIDDQLNLVYFANPA